MEESIREEVAQMRQEFEQRAQAKAKERWDQRVAEHEQRPDDSEA
ncbi:MULTISPECIES: hypothetical protein [Aeromonas]|nr:MULTISPECIES: hypothetical protein [Aeromonas]